MVRIKISIFFLFVCVTVSGIAQSFLSPLHLKARESDSASLAKLLHSPAYRTYSPAELQEVQEQNRRYNSLLADSLRLLEISGAALDSAGFGPAFNAILGRMYTYKEAQYRVRRGENAKTAIAQRVLGLAYGYPYLHESRGTEPRQYYDISRRIEEVWIYPLEQADTFFVVAVLLRLNPDKARTVRASDLEKTIHEHKLIDAERMDVAQKNSRDKKPFSGAYGGGSGGGIAFGTGMSVGGALSGRRLRYRPALRGSDTENSMALGKVAVSICVNAAGEVTSATYEKAKSTISDEKMIRSCLKNARNYRFEALEGAEQCGVITYHFKAK